MSKNNLLSEKKIPVLPKRLSLFQKISLLYSGKNTNQILVGTLIMATFLSVFNLIIASGGHRFAHWYKDLQKVATTGTVNRFSEIRNRNHGEGVTYEIFFSYLDEKNQQLSAECYAFDADAPITYLEGNSYPVEYIGGYRETAHIVGTSPKPVQNDPDKAIFYILITIWVGLCLLFIGLAIRNRRILTIFTQWKITIAEPQPKEKNFQGTANHHLPTTSQTFIFWDEQEREHEAKVVLEGAGNELLADEPWEVVLYNPQQPTAFFLWDVETAFPKMNPKGELVYNKIWYIWLMLFFCLLCTVLAIFTFDSPFRGIL